MAGRRLSVGLFRKALKSKARYQPKSSLLIKISELKEEYQSGDMSRLNATSRLSAPEEKGMSLAQSLRVSEPQSLH